MPKSKYSWIKVGARCRWYDPDPEGRDLRRVWTIVDIRLGDDEFDDDTIILITDKHGSEAEVWRTELIEYKRK